MRNVLVHGYRVVDREEVATAIRNGVPRLKAEVEHLLGESF